MSYPASKKGDVMICSIWSGPQRGIRIGKPYRQQHFLQKNNQVIIEIEGETASVDFSKFPSFWTSCPEIRVAKNMAGQNILKTFIQKNLLPPQESKKINGKKDVVYLEVVEPYKKFLLRL